MTHEQWNNGLNHLDPALIEEYVLQKDKAAYGRPAKRLYLRVVAAAACVCILLGAVTVGFFLQDRPPAGLPTPDTTDTQEDDTDKPNAPIPPANQPNPSLLKPLVYPGVLNGWQSQSIVLDASEEDPPLGDVDPPKFQFDCTDIIVKASIIEIYPDEYCVLASSASLPYRLIRFKVIQSVHGENIPQEFLYRLPSRLFVDLSPYDTFFLSMGQVGTAGYVMRNESQQRIEAMPLPVFGSSYSSPDLGSIIAFTDGVFNEELWKNESWLYGYQFGSIYLDHPEQGDLVVFRGCTEEDTLQAIKAQIESYTPTIPGAQTTPVVVTLQFTSEEALAAVEYVKPFENGVFTQTLFFQYYGPDIVVYRRYINGFETDETITIDLRTEEVTYSETRYSNEDIAQVMNMPLPIAELVAQYKENTPTPPHFVPTEEQPLCGVNVYGWYVKSGDTLYGVIQTRWFCYDYGVTDSEGMSFLCDEAYLLFDPSQDSPRAIDYDELIELVGT